MLKFGIIIIMVRFVSSRLVAAMLVVDKIHSTNSSAGGR
jgi:hypothetical protein